MPTTLDPNTSRRSPFTYDLASLAGCPTYVGKLVATTSVNNATTATPFVLAPGSVLLLQADAAFR